MRRVFILICFLVLSGYLGAQVKLETCSLKEALGKAKVENKKMMVIASTTWCGPCKRLYQTLFPLKEVGDFMNSKFVIKKYDIDKEDPDNIKSMNITGYPTFIILDTNGRELSRFCGVSMDAKSFMQQIEEALKEENYWDVRLLRFKNDSSYAKEHIIYLMQLKRFEDADDAINQIFEKRCAEDNFSDEFLSIYQRLISGGGGEKTLKLLAEHRQDGEMIMGKEAFSSYMQEIGTDLVFHNGDFPSQELLDKRLGFIERYPVMKSVLVEFVVRVRKDIVANRIVRFVNVAQEMMNRFSSQERYAIACYIADHVNLQCEEEKSCYVDYLEKALSIETDENFKACLNSRLKNINK